MRAVKAADTRKNFSSVRGGYYDALTDSGRKGFVRPFIHDMRNQAASGDSALFASLFLPALRDAGACPLKSEGRRQKAEVSPRFTRAY